MADIKNKSARFEYFIDDTFTAGLVLTGTEVKALREGKGSFNDAYCIIHKGEVFLRSFHISPYSHGTFNNHDPLRERKLLLNKKEIRKIEGKLKEKGYTLVPLKAFFNADGLVKLEIGLGKGKKLHDKRATIKDRDNERELRRYK